MCRKHGISSATFYKWKAKFGGLEVSDAKRLQALEDENAKLKKLLAEAMLDNAMLKDITAENSDARRQTAAVAHTCRLYREEKLQVRKRGGRKRALGVRAPIELRDELEVYEATLFSDASGWQVAVSRGHG